MSSRHIGGLPVKAPRDNLIEKWVYFAEVSGFVFQFADLDQVRECKEYFSKTAHPSTREPGHDLEHYWQSWETRLPKSIKSGAKREKVLKALDQILDNYHDL